ncbi:MAG: tRNA epoxyqueuosine(34) reductase QueG [Candidatus Hydrogenedentota bacterium]
MATDSLSSDNGITRAAAVKEHARSQGFDACGVAAAGPADPEGKLRAWLDRGYHAGMDWLARTSAIRQDVREKLPGAASVVVVARNYYKPAPLEAQAQDRSAPLTPGETKGAVARYAWGRDYHRVMAKPLKRLAAYIETLEPGAQSYTSIDSGPVLERTWAERAGVGWVGKNSLILRRDMGSWFCLGVIITTARLEPDHPTRGYCGSCRLCIDACPTGAIVEEGVVDAGRCISYHTIENRGDIPESVGSRMGAWVFGCDICQEVCPWNRKTPVSDEPDFEPRTGQAAPDLEELAELGEDTFRDRFSGSPLMRAKHAGMVRNARIAIQNTQQFKPRCG